MLQAAGAWQQRGDSTGQHCCCQRTKDREVSDTPRPSLQEAKQQLNEPEVSGGATDSESGVSDGPDHAEKSAPAAAENSWSAPLLSLARKATETISSGMSYAAAPRNPSQGSAPSSPTEQEPEKDFNNTPRKLPGGLWPQLTFSSSYFSFVLLGHE